MPAFCAVLNCRDKYGHSEFISYHKFPTKRKDIFEKWLEFAQRGPDWQPSKWSAVCSRHFREEDFSCVNERKTLKKTAIPTIIMLEHTLEQPTEEQQDSDKCREVLAKNSNKSKKISSVVAAEDARTATQAEQQLQCAATSNAPKINCRLCGIASAMVVTFASNFEIYGMIQKCFPTLNIQQDDYLPKEMCRNCLKRLEDFSRFIDEVLQTQSELQCKFRFEKPTSNRNMSERQLKIKQEPVVRVKQEVAEGYESFLSDDMDMGVDEGCEQEHDNGIASGEHFEQKYEFCDFPMLNAQDIINNCDIMEIINLDDPFIDIPDDDANTINNSAGTELNEASPNTADRLKGDLQSAHELLQTHMLIEEHNYAKEDWNFYKKEKTEGYEYVTNVAQLQQNYNQHTDNLTTLLPNAQQPLPLTTPACQPQNSQSHCAEFVPYFSASHHELESEETTRSAKPIVTSVSAIAESHETRKARLEFADSSEKANTPAAATTTKKPNIVVLNESIVKSSAAFQLHACNVCQLKFFSLDGLSQHYVKTHNQMPMVTVPNINITMTETQAIAALSADFETERMRNCKVEEGCERDGNCEDSATAFNNEQAYNTNDQQAAIATETSAIETPVKDPAKTSQEKSNNHIDILEMQQTFHRQAITAAAVALHEINALDVQNQIYHSQSNNTPDAAVNETITNTTAATTMEESVFKMPKTWSVQQKQQQVLARNEYSKSRRLKSKLAMKKYKTRLYLTNVAENYRQLQRRYQQLQRKCQQLEQRNELPAPRANKKMPHCRAACCKCMRKFPCIQQLLQHKQAKKHYFLGKVKHFAASCYGCEKFFRSKIALRNHMRYICQSLSLRCLKKQMQTFKCRHCRSITFTHWRLYRRHEIKCKTKTQSKKKKTMRTEQQLLQYIKTCLIKQQYVQQPYKKCLKHNETKANKLQTVLKQAQTQAQLQTQATTPSKQLFACPDCTKSFATLNTYNQHRITHTVERTHKCALCARVFKRRNGLMQHVKGFHLELKPYKCPICAHSYALKCDMLRCRHSTLRRC